MSEKTRNDTKKTEQKLRLRLSINRLFRLLAAVSRISVFLLTCAAEKLLVSENRLTSDFQERVGDIGGSRAQSENPLDFRRAAFPPRECRLCRHSQHRPADLCFSIAEYELF